MKSNKFTGVNDEKRKSIQEAYLTRLLGMSRVYTR